MNGLLLRTMRARRLKLRSKAFAISKQPVTWAELQSVAGLAKCEPIKSNQGSLFALTEDEFDAIRALIYERNPVTAPPKRRAFHQSQRARGPLHESCGTRHNPRPSPAKEGNHPSRADW